MSQPSPVPIPSQAPPDTVGGRGRGDKDSSQAAPGKKWMLSSDPRGVQAQKEEVRLVTVLEG